MLCVCLHRDEQEYESEIQRQRDELAELSAERQRLLMMQQHLYKLQESLAAATSAAAQVLNLLHAGVKLAEWHSCIVYVDKCKHLFYELLKTLCIVLVSIHFVWILRL